MMYFTDNNDTQVYKCSNLIQTPQTKIPISYRIQCDQRVNLLPVYQKRKAKLAKVRANTAIVSRLPVDLIIRSTYLQTRQVPKDLITHASFALSWPSLSLHIFLPSAFSLMLESVSTRMRSIFKLQRVPKQRWTIIYIDLQCCPCNHFFSQKKCLKQDSNPHS